MEKNNNLKISYISCFFIKNISELLQLSHTTFCTSVFLFHKFYRKKNFIKYNNLDVAISCILVASKLEEQNCNLKRIICVYNFLKSEYFETKYQNLTVLDASKIKERIVLIEMNILKYFGFNPIIINPLKILHCFFTNNKDICIQFIKNTDFSFVNTPDINTNPISTSDSNFKAIESQINISNHIKMKDTVISNCKDKFNDISKYYKEFIYKVTKKLNDLIFCPGIINLDIHLICYIAIYLSFNLDKEYFVKLDLEIEKELNFMYKLYDTDFKERNFFKNKNKIPSDDTNVKKSIEDFLVRENAKKHKKN
ncbi:putative cyclin [Hamiltosporidium magnivora]|uniref:Putative cyclin n=1 Tax=Hamiltosporidium magnivora TaxID=148818 RepID=A0A4V2JUC2_9MICR|nr:putative cyclin [Hamiltosporidium magnivora]